MLNQKLEKSNEDIKMTEERSHELCNEIDNLNKLHHKKDMDYVEIIGELKSEIRNAGKLRPAIPVPKKKKILNLEVTMVKMDHVKIESSVN